MKVFIVGDHRTGTGPANVTKEYIKNMSQFCKKVLYQKQVSKIARVPELVIKIAACDVVLFSGYSRQNILGIKIAKLFGKKTAYLMHGCVEYENEINGVPDETMNACERQTLAGCDRIFAVSERFANWLKKQYPEYVSKIDFAINGVDEIVSMKANAANNSEKMGDSTKATIFSIGGGMPRKKICHICEAVELLNGAGANLKLVVAGDVGLDTKIINSYSFVENLGIVGRDKIRELFASSDLFVQNSCFETFGLAPVEALANGCNVLLSNAVGALDIIGDIKECDVIEAFNNKQEIAQKIKFILDNPNNKRLAAGIDYEKCSWKNRTFELCTKIERLI